jgi:hypothetical protein
MRQIPNFPAYHATADGEIYRGDRALKPSPNGKGYMRVFLRKDGKTHTRYVHRIICETFNGPPSEGDEARHRNGVRDDNCAANLVWGTHAENEADKEAHGTLLWGESVGTSKLTAATVTAMRDMVRGGVSMQDAAKCFGVLERVAADAITGRRWRRLPGAIPPYTTRRQLSEDQVREIRRLAGTMRQADIGAKYGIGRTAVQQILYGKAYQWVA